MLKSLPHIGHGFFVLAVIRDIGDGGALVFEGFLAFDVV